MVWIVVSALFLSQVSFARTKECASSERNSETRAPFTEAQYIDTVQFWRSEEPWPPGLLKLYRGYRLYKREQPNLRKVKGDKAKHCYMGCRVAQDISFELAVYMAWYKELLDLTDCDRGSAFEVEDFEATLEGAEMALRDPDQVNCLNLCR